MIKKKIATDQKVILNLVHGQNSLTSQEDVEHTEALYPTDLKAVTSKIAQHIISDGMIPQNEVWIEKLAQFI